MGELGVRLIIGLLAQAVAFGDLKSLHGSVGFFVILFFSNFY